MPKTIICPVERWAGSVTLVEPMPLPLVVELEKAIEAAQTLESPTRSQTEAALLGAALKCVASHNLSGLSETLSLATWPGTPRLDSARLFGWLMDEVMSIYTGEVARPLG